MKRLFKLFLMLLSFAAFVSCDSEFEIVVVSEGKAQINFRSEFSRIFIDTFGVMSGNKEGAQTINADNARLIMANAGLKTIKASMQGAKLNAQGLYEQVSGNLSQAGILVCKKNSMSLTLGPDQYKSLYEMMDEEGKGYFDLLMIPCLVDEEMTEQEYNDTLASLYGQKFASDLSEGKIKISLCSPDKKVKKEETITLGTLLTLRQSKTWSINW